MSGKVVIESIAKGAGRLIGDNRKLRGEVERLEASRRKLKEENRQLAAENAVLQRRLTVKELAVDFSGGGAGRDGVKIARARVGRLLREVDRCIALLSRE